MRHAVWHDSERRVGGLETASPGRHVRGFASVERVAQRRLARRDGAATLGFLRVPLGNLLDAPGDGRTGSHKMRIEDRWRLSSGFADGCAYDAEIVDRLSGPRRRGICHDQAGPDSPERGARTRFPRRRRVVRNCTGKGDRDDASADQRDRSWPARHHAGSGATAHAVLRHRCPEPDEPPVMLRPRTRGAGDGTTLCAPCGPARWPE